MRNAMFFFVNVKQLLLSITMLNNYGSVNGSVISLYFTVSLLALWLSD